MTLTQAQLEAVTSLRDLVRAAANSRGGQAPVAEDARWIAPLGPMLQLVRTIAIWLLRVAMRRAFRLTVSGIEHLPADGPVLLCPNHASYLDPFAVATALPAGRLRATYWGGWTGVLFSSIWRRLFSRGAQVIPVEPGQGAAAAVTLAAQVLARGETMVWFAEGARSRDGTVQPFQPGLGILVQRAPQIPIVPVRVAGTFAAWPPRQRLPRLRPVTVRFGQPLNAARLREESGDDPRHIAERVREAVAGLPN